MNSELNEGFQVPDHVATVSDLLKLNSEPVIEYVPNAVMSGEKAETLTVFYADVSIGMVVLDKSTGVATALIADRAKEGPQLIEQFRTIVKAKEVIAAFVDQHGKVLVRY